MMSMGENGYLDTCLKIVGATKRIEEAIRTSSRLKDTVVVVGKPMVSVVAFKARPKTDIDIYDVADAMSSRGWHLNALQDPPAIHVAVTLPIVAATDDLIRDIEEVVEECRLKAAEARASGKLVKKGDAAALYGVAGALPDKTIVRDLAAGFLDCLYKT